MIEGRCRRSDGIPGVQIRPQHTEETKPAQHIEQHNTLMGRDRDQFRGCVVSCCRHLSLYGVPDYGRRHCRCQVQLKPMAINESLIELTVSRMEKGNCPWRVMANRWRWRIGDNWTDIQPERGAIISPVPTKPLWRRLGVVFRSWSRSLVSSTI